MTAVTLLLARLLREPRWAGQVTLAQWDLVIPQARRAGLLARLCYLLEGTGAIAGVPPAPCAHLEEARILADKHARDVRWETECILAVLRPIVDRVILLKGGAYVVAGLPPARGRVFTDVDILVPRDQIVAVEGRLRAAGWVSGEVDPYDDRYYRNWTHQIPPLTHFARQTTIDVHHTIVPQTAQTEVEAAKLFARAQPIAGFPGLAVLQPADMVLHSATHLFNEGEFGRGLRDLDDLNLLIRHFSASPDFWATIVGRAAELDLSRPLYYALRYTSRLLGTPVPQPVLDATATTGPGALMRGVMDGLFGHALRPDHPSCRTGFSGTALWLLYVRSHHLRMPMHLLLPHLVRKAVMRRLEEWGIEDWALKKPR